MYQSKKSLIVTLVFLIIALVIRTEKTKAAELSEKDLVVAEAAMNLMTSSEQGMLNYVNSYRKSRGIRPLLPLKNCVKMAEGHAKDMVLQNYFDHSTWKESFSQRALRYGVKWAGENIAMGNMEIQRTFNQWRNSAGHNRNMLKKNYKYSGIGYYQKHWVQCFSAFPQ